MASYKIFLYKHKEKNGTYPIVLRIIKDRKAKYIFLRQRIKEKDWNYEEGRVKKSHPNSRRINNLILKKEAEVNDMILENESKKKNYSAGMIQKELKGNKKDITFFQFADEHISDLFKQKRYTVAGPERSRIKKFKEFLNETDLFLQDINVALLNKFKIYLSVKGKSKRSIVNHLIILRTLFNKAIKEGIVDKSFYPFAGDNIKIRGVDSLKIGLEKDELQEIIKLNYPASSPKWHTRNVFLISFYFAGARISDVLQLKWTDLQKGRLTYKMGKNDKSVSIKIPAQAKEIINHYKKEKRFEDDYVFPDLKNTDPSDKLATVTRIRTATKRFNNYLEDISKDAGITKNVTNHIARHTFGNIAGDRIPIPMLQKLYRHSSMLTTAKYQGNFMHKDTDDALDSVVNL